MDNKEHKLDTIAFANAGKPIESHHVIKVSLFISILTNYLKIPAYNLIYF